MQQQQQTILHDLIKEDDDLFGDLDDSEMIEQDIKEESSTPQITLANSEISPSMDMESVFDNFT